MRGEGLVSISVKELFGSDPEDQVRIIRRAAEEFDDAVRSGAQLPDTRSGLQIALGLFFAAAIEECSDWDESVTTSLAAFKIIRSIVLENCTSKRTETAVDASAMRAAGADFGFLYDYGWKEAEMEDFLHEVFLHADENHIAQMSDSLKLDLENNAELEDARNALRGSSDSRELVYKRLFSQHWKRGIEEYCYGCMEPLGEARSCARCGRLRGRREALPHQLRPGTTLNEGRYLLGRVIGQGGFGITYIGRDLTLNMRVAVKEYFPRDYASRNAEDSTEVSVVSDTLTESTDCGTGMTDESQARFAERGKKRFLDEARVLAKMNEAPGVVNVRDFFEDNGTAYIVMEFLEGQTLRDCLVDGLFLPEDILARAVPMMRTLETIHAQGVVHRDISPDNIMILRDGRLKLMDFGAAREMNFADRRSVSVLLKHGYAPEEQYRPNGAQGPWTDVYAFCATLYKCITGRTPDNALERMREDEMMWPSQLGIAIDPSLESAMRKGMAVAREDRFQDFGQLRGAMGNVLLPDGSDTTAVENGAAVAAPIRNQAKIRHRNCWTECQEAFGDKANNFYDESDMLLVDFPNASDSDDGDLAAECSVPKPAASADQNKRQDIELTVFSPVSVNVYCEDYDHCILTYDANSSFPYAIGSYTVEKEFTLLLRARGFEKTVAFFLPPNNKLKIDIENYATKAEIERCYDRQDALNQIKAGPTGYAFAQLSHTGKSDDISMLVELLGKYEDYCNNQYFSLEDSEDRHVAWLELCCARCLAALGKKKRQHGWEKHVEDAFWSYPKEARAAYGWQFPMLPRVMQRLLLDDASNALDSFQTAVNAGTVDLINESLVKAEKSLSKLHVISNDEPAIQAVLDAYNRFACSYRRFVVERDDRSKAGATADAATKDFTALRKTLSSFDEQP